jgi:hypothetical protein
MSMADTNPVSHVFVLIHGTFARGAKWTGEDSSLCRALKSAYPRSRIMRFEWTGANAHSARLSAAELLREFVRTAAAERPRAGIHLICHSHGGNISLYALKEKSIRERVASLVCISTPFIRCIRRDTGSLVVRLAFVLCALLVTGVELTAYYLGSMIGRVGEIMLVGNLLVLFATHFGARRFGRRILRAFHAKQDAIAERIDPGEPGVIVLVIRSALDEAAMFLRLSFIVTRIPHLLNVIALTLLLFSVVGVGYYAYSSGLRTGGSIEYLYLTWFKVAMMALISFGLVITASLIARAHPLVFGWEGLFDSLFVDLDVSTTPSFPAVEHKVGLPGRFWGRHSALYGHETILQFLPQWVGMVDRLDP